MNEKRLKEKLIDEISIAVTKAVVLRQFGEKVDEADMIADQLIASGLVQERKEEPEMKIKLDIGAKKPTRAHPTDAGLDLYAREEQTIPARGSVKFDTGVHVELPLGTVGMLKSKSGLNVKHGITSEGVIDVGYTGSIVVKLYNHSDEDYTVHAGDKISQLVVMPIRLPTISVVVDLDETDRGDNGFGSSGR